jgi:hypothetical protein
MIPCRSRLTQPLVGRPLRAHVPQPAPDVLPLPPSPQPALPPPPPPPEIIEPPLPGQNIPIDEPIVPGDDLPLRAARRRPLLH